MEAMLARFLGTWSLMLILLALPLRVVQIEVADGVTTGWLMLIVVFGSASMAFVIARRTARHERSFGPRHSSRLRRVVGREIINPLARRSNL